VEGAKVLTIVAVEEIEIVLEVPCNVSEDVLVMHQWTAELALILPKQLDTTTIRCTECALHFNLQDAMAIIKIYFMMMKLIHLLQGSFRYLSNALFSELITL
jgi:hypothetical protein